MKKKSLIFIILAVIAVVVIIGAIVLINSTTSNNSGKKSKSAKINGTVELLKEYETTGGQDVLDDRAVNTSRYIYEISNNQESYIDKNGNIIATGRHDKLYPIYPLGDDYFVEIDKYKTLTVRKDNKDIYTDKIDNSVVYRDDVIYYSYTENSQSYAVAYNLKQGKILWKVLGEHPFILDNDYVVIDKYDNKTTNVVNKKDGKSILKNINEGETIYISQAGYFKITKNREIETYDFNNNKLSTTPIKEKGVISKLSNGGFIISESDNSKFTVYNNKGKVILEAEGSVIGFNTYTQEINGIMTKGFGTSDYSVVKSNRASGKNYLVYNDGTVIEFSPSTSIDNDSGFGHYDVNTTPRFIVSSYGDNYSDTMIIDAKTKKSKVLGIKMKNQLKYHENGEYIILEKAGIEKHFYVYNSEFEKVYESDNSLWVLNDSWFIDASTTSAIKTKFVNASTLEEKEIDLDGVFDFNNETNIVTREFGKQHLYAIK